MPNSPSPSDASTQALTQVPASLLAARSPPKAIPRPRSAADQLAEELLRVIHHEAADVGEAMVLRSVLLLSHLEAAGMAVEDITLLARTATQYARHMLTVKG